MSFFFKKDKSKPGSSSSNTHPSATRDIRSSDGAPSTSSSSQIPTLNGAVASQKPSSPSPGASVNNSLNSLAGNETAVRSGTASGASGRPSQQEERAASATERSSIAAPPSPEQKVMRDPSLRNGAPERAPEPVCLRRTCLMQD